MSSSHPVRRVPWPSVAGTVLRRPDLWLTALGVGRRFAPRRWWRRRPFLPVPSASYLRFRLQTQYGDEDISKASIGADVIDYLEWCRSWRRRS